MHLETPSWLYLIWLPLALAALTLWGVTRGRRAAERFAEPRMLARLVPPRSPARRAIRLALFTMGLIALIVALARPRYGESEVRVVSRGLDLMVVLDVSRSMQATDVKPTRLERAKSDIRDLLKRLEGDRVGLMVFSGSTVMRVPLTTDLGFFRLSLDEVDTDSAARGGSLIGDAIREATRALEPGGGRASVILLITDGEDQDSFPLEAAQAAARERVRIFTVGLGDTGEGSRIPVRDEQGRLSYVQHDGQEVWSRLDEPLLRDIALETGGAYVPVRTRTYDLGSLYDNYLASLERGEIRSDRRQRRREQYQLPLLLALGCLLLESWLPAERRESPVAREHRRERGASHA